MADTDKKLKDERQAAEGAELASIRSMFSGDLIEALRASGQGVRSLGPQKTNALPEAHVAVAPIAVVIELNTSFPGGSKRAQRLLMYAIERIIETHRSQVADQNISRDMPPKLKRLHSEYTNRYVFTELSLNDLVSLTKRYGTTIPIRGSKGQLNKPNPKNLIKRIWRDQRLNSYVLNSLRTTKADAAQISFPMASGEGIVWAIADTGVASGHPHFKKHSNFDLPDGIRHMDFTADSPHSTIGPPKDGDERAHGTHVAGIIAGEWSADENNGGSALVFRSVLGNPSEPKSQTYESQVSKDHFRGMAPKCKLLILKVLRDRSDGELSSLLAAIGYIQKVNAESDVIKIHGLNLSLGHDFDASWFAAGASPLCKEVDRLVKSGVCVVVAAGNAGYGYIQAGSIEHATTTAVSLQGTISDPGNARLAITVGATHRDEPFRFGVSYFSGKGPTADGRMKPDVVAPGERIVSCGIDNEVDGFPPTKNGSPIYREDSGTSMAAPHVSGIIAGYLSARKEMRGQPEEVKRRLERSAITLERRPEFEGAGLVDAMALHSDNFRR